MKDVRMLEGKWQVIRIYELVDDYLVLSPDPHIRLQSSTSKSIHGTYEFGAQSGDIDGRVGRSKDDQLILTFTVEGTDEMDPVHGFGTATLVDDNTLEGEMRYYISDTYRFIWKRIE